MHIHNLPLLLITQPLTLADVLLIEYLQTAKGDQFILYDSGTFKSFHNFWAHQNIEMLPSSQIWFSDGTFKSAPALLHKSMSSIHSVGRRILWKTATCYPAGSFCSQIRRKLYT